jgi:hypothetical protein
MAVDFDEVRRKMHKAARDAVTARSSVEITPLVPEPSEAAEVPGDATSVSNQEHHALPEPAVELGKNEKIISHTVDAEAEAEKEKQKSEDAKKEVDTNYNKQIDPVLDRIADLIDDGNFADYEDWVKQLSGLWEEEYARIRLLPEPQRTVALERFNFHDRGLKVELAEFEKKIAAKRITPAPPEILKDTEKKIEQEKEYVQGIFDYEVMSFIREASEYIKRDDVSSCEESIRRAYHSWMNERYRVEQLPNEVYEKIIVFYNSLDEEFVNKINELENEKDVRNSRADSAHSLVPSPTSHDLESARNAYFEARKKIDNLGFIRQHIWPLNKDSVKKLEAEEKITREAYEKTRAKFIGENVKVFINEKTELLKFDIQQRKEKGSGILAQGVRGLRVAADIANKGFEASRKMNLERALSFSPKALAIVDRITLPATQFEVRGKNYSLPELHVGKGLARAVSVRTAISVGLLGLGHFYGTGYVVGKAAIGIRPLYIAAMSGIGMKKTTEGISQWVNNKKSGVGNTEGDYLELSNKLAVLTAQESINGKNLEEIEKNPTYQALLRQLEIKLAEKKSDLESKFANEDVAKILNDRLNDMEAQVKTSFRNQKIVKFGASVIGAGWGFLAYKGGILSLFGKKAEHATTAPRLKDVEKGASGSTVLNSKPPLASGQPSAVVSSPEQVPPDTLKIPENINPNVGVVKASENISVDQHQILANPNVSPPSSPVEIPTHPAIAPESAQLPAEGGDGFNLQVSGRGLEGTLLASLKDGQNQKMLSWLQQNYSSVHGNNDPSALVHRFVTSNPESGDLEHIMAGSSVHIGVNGQIVLDKDNLHFASVSGGETSVNNPVSSGVHTKEIPPMENRDVIENMPQTTQAPSLQELKDLPMQNNPSMDAGFNQTIPQPEVLEFNMASHEYIQKYGQDAYGHVINKLPSGAGVGSEQSVDDAKLLLAETKVDLVQQRVAEARLHAQEAAMRRMQDLRQAVKPAPVTVEGSGGGQPFSTNSGSPKFTSAGQLNEYGEPITPPGSGVEVVSYQDLLEQVKTIPQTSEALKVALGADSDQYRFLMGGVDTASEKLDKVAGLTISNFKDQFNSSPDFAKEYENLMEFLKEGEFGSTATPLREEAYQHKTSIREFLLFLASQIKKKGI